MGCHFLESPLGSHPVHGLSLGLVFAGLPRMTEQRLQRPNISLSVHVSNYVDWQPNFTRFIRQNCFWGPFCRQCFVSWEVKLMHQSTRPKKNFASWIHFYLTEAWACSGSSRRSWWRRGWARWPTLRSWWCSGGSCARPPWPPEHRPCSCRQGTGNSYWCWKICSPSIIIVV